MLLWKEKLSFHIVVDTKLLFCFFLLKDTKKHLLGWKNIKNVNFCRVVTKTVYLFVIVRHNMNILDISNWKTDLSPYCIIATFLQSCKRSSYLLFDCSDWNCFSEKKTFCECCLFDKDMYTFSDDFFKLNKSSKMSKIFNNFVLFYRILNY